MPPCRPFADRQKVATLSEIGHSQAQICQLTGFDRQFVRRWMEEENFEERSRGQGHNKKLSPAIIRRVKKMAKGKKNASLRSIVKKLKRRGKTTLSRESVRSALRIGGLKAFKRRKRPLLTESHRKRRVKYARTWKGHDWSTTLFSDEKSWYYTGNRKGVIWTDSQDDPALNIEAPKHPYKVKNLQRILLFYRFMHGVE